MLSAKPRRPNGSKLKLILLAGELGSVSLACARLGYSRDSFYRFKKVYDRDGAIGLMGASRGKTRAGSRTKSETEARVIDYSCQHPQFGQGRVARELMRLGHSISPTGVRQILLRNGLETIEKRLSKIRSSIEISGNTAAPERAAYLDQKKKSEGNQEGEPKEGGQRPTRSQRITRLEIQIEPAAPQISRPMSSFPNGYSGDELPRIVDDALLRPHLGLPSKADQVVVLVAPAGYGKTTLAVQWYQETVKIYNAGWFQIDEQYRDPTVFLIKLSRALHIKWIIELNMFSGAEDQEAAIDALLSIVEARRDRHVLFIDDVHLLVGSSATKCLDQLLRRAPRNMTLVMSSCDSEGLGLASIALRKKVRWISSGQLALNRDEIVILSERKELALTHDDVTAIMELTEGWPALVQLALCGQVDHDGRTPKNSSTLVTIFVRQRLLSLLTDYERSVVYIIALLEVITSDLLEALTSGPVIGTLNHLEATGVIRRQSRQGQSPLLTMNPLIREEVVLRASGYDANSWEIKKRAAVWWWAHGQQERAIRLALVAGMKRHLRTWLRSYGPILVQQEGRHETFLALLMAAERLWGQRDPYMTSWAVSALMFLRRYLDAERLLDDIAATQKVGKQTFQNTYSDATDLQRSVIAGLRDDYVSAGKYARRWIKHSRGESFNHGMAWIALAYSQKCASQFSQVDVSLKTARGLMLRCNSSYGMAWSQVIGLLSLIKEGRFRELLAESEAIVGEGPGVSPGITDLMGLMKAACAFVRYERNELGQSRAALEIAMPRLHRQGIVDAMIAGYVTAARLCAVQGNLDAALDALVEGQRVGVERDLHRLHVTLGAERVMILARHGATREARSIAEDTGFLANQPKTSLLRDKGARVLARLALAEGRPDSMGEILRPMLQRARSTGQRYKYAGLLLFEALRVDALGRSSAALELLSESLEIGMVEGYQRLYLDEGEPVSKMLRALTQRPSPSLTVNTFARKLLQGPPPTVSLLDDVLEPLTQREIQILIHVSEGKSNQEIARITLLTEGTIKWHLHNIYSKLQVGNRTAALHTARKANLIG